MSIKDGKRIVKTKALPNHEVLNFPNEGNPNTISVQNRVCELPLNPIYVGNSKWVIETGVGLIGVKFRPEANERIEYSSGDVYRIEVK